jgi:hypothetical protein
MVKIGLVVSKVGAWLTRGGKKIDSRYIPNGIIHDMGCRGLFYELQGWVDMLACTHDSDRLVRDLRMVVDKVNELIDEIPREVENG